ncbi:MAG: hypothetical protein ABID54_10695 [Pseudomonadota bacterium]
MLYSLQYTDSMPDWKAGYSRAWFVRIRPAYKDDKGLLAHEIEHTRHWWYSLGFSSILYLLSKRFRLWVEVNCYKVQLEYAADRELARRAYALRIAEHYNLGITVGEALIALGG